MGRLRQDVDLSRSEVKRTQEQMQWLKETALQARTAASEAENAGMKSDTTTFYLDMVGRLATAKGEAAKHEEMVTWSPFLIGAVLV